MNEMTSLERVVTALKFKEPDRVPLFLLLTMHGAKELGLSIRDYFGKSGNVVEGQLRLLEKYHSDCLYPFFHASLEHEAWGGEVLYVDDGPPNAGEPLIRSVEQIQGLTPPDVESSASLRKVLEAISALKERAGEATPIIGVVISPFSLPVMQMGFGPYIELMQWHPDLFWKLMQVNEAYSVKWANAQIRAGATAICYFDPVSSPTIIQPEMFRQTGLVVARRMLSAIQGPVAFHLASGRAMGITEELPLTGARCVGVSAEENLAELKDAFHGKLALVGNLNGIEMRSWDALQAETTVKDAIRAAGAGGGFILSDNHGEIPFPVSEDVLLSISDAVRRWGGYPLKVGDGN